MLHHVWDHEAVVIGVLLTSIALVGTNSAIAQETRCPNIVLIIGDDHGYPYFGFTGSPHVHTPHLDELAQNGAAVHAGSYKDNHCRPVLQPLVTGLYPMQ